MLNNLIAMLKQLESSRFYGSLEIKFENGHISLVRKSENFKTLEFHLPNSNNSTAYGNPGDRHDNKY